MKKSPITAKEIIIGMQDTTKGARILVKTGIHMGSVCIPVRDMLKGENIYVNKRVYQNHALATGIANINGFLAEVAYAKNLMDCYVVYECCLEELMRRVDEVNAEVLREAEDFVAHYDEHVEAFVESITKNCVDNRKKKMAKNIISDALSRYPSKDKILSSKLVVIFDTDGTEAYEDLLASTRELVDNSRLVQAEHNRCFHLSAKCTPIIENLYKFSHQILEGKLHGGTINSYNTAVDILRIANTVELSSPLPELEAFLSVANYAVDNPALTVDRLLMGFISFFYNQGMIDYIPYDVIGEAYSPGIVEAVGQDANNSFAVIAAEIRKL
jgi:DNA-binding Lrp family transcriptional regulator